MSFVQNNTPYNIIMEPVTTKNGWYLINYNNTLCIRKTNTPYYYTTNSVYHFGNTRPIIDTTPNLQYIGEYKPVMLESNYFASLPLNINDNVFFVNQLTRIVYIKPRDLTIIIPQTMPYDFKLYESFTFAGNYNPYLNSISSSNKIFSDIIPKTVFHKTPIVDTSEKHHIDPIENTLTENPYPNMKSTHTMPSKQILNMPYSSSGNTITFIIPFLTNWTTNSNSLFKTIESIMTRVTYSKIYVVTNNSRLQFPENISRVVTIVPQTKYVGRLGYENKLNMKMDNGCDVASFYNYLVSNLVKTQLYTIWNYNWLIEDWNETIVSSRCFSVPNCYIDEEDTIKCQSLDTVEPELATKTLEFPGRYKSNKFGRIGYILSNKMKYSTSTDGIDINVPGIRMNSIDYKIKVFGIYDSLDYDDRKNMMLYGNELELRTYFENKKNNLSSSDFVQKII
jgi:hypothetical protein